MNHPYRDPYYRPESGFHAYSFLMYPSKTIESVRDIIAIISFPNCEYIQVFVDTGAPRLLPPLKAKYHTWHVSMYEFEPRMDSNKIISVRDRRISKRREIIIRVVEKCDNFGQLYIEEHQISIY